MPLRPEPVRDDELRGQAAERALRRTLRRRVEEGRLHAVVFPDAVVVPFLGARPFCVDLKSQERFVAPPFDGHGLPVLQADEYDALRIATGIDTLLVIWEPNGGSQWHARLSDCVNGEAFETAGSHKYPRRIFPIGAFNEGRWP